MRVIAVDTTSGPMLVVVSTGGSVALSRLDRPAMPANLLNDLLEANGGNLPPKTADMFSAGDCPDTLQEKRERSRATMPRPARCVQRTGLTRRTPSPDARAAASRRATARG